MNRRIIVIDDSLDIWQAYTDVLGNREEYANDSGHLQELLEEIDGQQVQDPFFELLFADQGEKGYGLVEQALGEDRPFAVAFIDIRMPPGWDGMETAAKIRAIDPELEIVIVTAYSDRSRREIVRTVGTPEKLLFLRKPFDPDELYQLALSLCGKWNLARQQTEMTKAMQSSEARFRNLVETTSDWVWEMDKDGVFTYCSPVCEDIYGYRPDELIGKSIYNTLFEEMAGVRYRRFFERFWNDRRSFKSNERQCRRKDGADVHIESSGVPVLDSSSNLVAYRGVDRDITERRRHENERRKLEEQFRQSQKMEAIGTLAGGIAHDLNNMLTPILGYTEICLLQTEDDSPLRKSLEVINQSASKAADLIRQILAFSRKQILSTQVIDLNTLVGELVKILRRLIREDIELELDLSETCWTIKADSSQVEQILINLVVNARDAVDSNGKIIISTRNESICSDEVKDIDLMPIAGDFVVLTVSDNGSGMDPETANRIFDPFYTTKDVGKGTGLGLATVYGVVNQHKARLRLETALGQGAAFSVYFPRCQEVRQHDPLHELDGAPLGSETILIAEDDAVVRQVAVSILDSLGYSVLEAIDGRSALEIFEKKDGGIALLLTDLVMPGMGGRELAERCLARVPDLPVIFMSGYPFDQALLKGGETSSVTFLTKPFNTNALAWKVREVLDSNKSTGGKGGADIG